MLDLNGPVPAAGVEQPKKQMLTWTLNEGRYKVSINSSSLDLVSTCLRKAHYSLNLGLQKPEESTALAFGSSVHKALELWYQLPVAQRALPKAYEEQAELYAFGQDLDKPAEHPALECLRQFVLCRHTTLASLPETDRRSLASGIRILKAYFKHYAEDGFVVALDDEGKPLVERTIAAHLSTVEFNGLPVDIEYFGTVDVILKNQHTGFLMVADHKTTTALGAEFYNRCKPNPQYTGYVWLARKLGINTSMFMINGIQTAKTKTEFARQVTERTEDDFEELKSSVERAVVQWLWSAHVLEAQGLVKAYPMTSPNPCSMYGGCQFRTVCELPPAMRENAIRANFKELNNATL